MSHDTESSNVLKIIKIDVQWCFRWYSRILHIILCCFKRQIAGTVYKSLGWDTYKIVSLYSVTENPKMRILASLANFLRIILRNLRPKTFVIVRIVRVIRLISVLASIANIVVNKLSHTLEGDTTAPTSNFEGGTELKMKSSCVLDVG